MDVFETGEGGELSAWVDQVAAAPPAIGRALGLRAEVFPGGWRVDAPTVPDALLNRVVFTETPSTDAVLAAVASFAGRPRWRIQLVGEDERMGLLGLVLRDRWIKLRRPLDLLPVVPPGPRPVLAPRGAGFGSTVAAAYRMPGPLAEWIDRLPGRVGWRCWVAVEDGVPVGAGAAHLTGDLAWFGIAGTLPTARGRGAQSALLAARLADAAAHGCRFAVTETGEDRPDRPNPSLRNLLRAGFVEHYRRGSWGPPLEPTSP